MACTYCGGEIQISEREVEIPKPPNAGVNLNFTKKVFVLECCVCGDWRETHNNDVFRCSHCNRVIIDSLLFHPGVLKDGLGEAVKGECVRYGTTGTNECPTCGIAATARRKEREADEAKQALDAKIAEERLLAEKNHLCVICGVKLGIFQKKYCSEHKFLA